MNVSKRLASLVINVAKQQHRSIYRRSYSDPFLGLASSLMRSLDREFNQMRNSMLPSLLGATSSLSSPRLFDLAPERIQQEDAIITDEQGNKKFHLEFDLRGFNPDEIKVKTENKMLTVSAKKEKKVRFLFK
jgi:HSP20 family molecular chaperone IbpA